VLGVLLEGGKSIRVKDIRKHPQFSWYPEHHPELMEFLGVPVLHRGEVLGEIYLSGTPAEAFTAADQRVVEMLAAHAGIAIATANLYVKSQELAILEERNRVARELHDAVAQTLFSMMYEARAAAITARDDPTRAVETLQRLEQQSADALSEMRGLVYALRPKSLERDGLAVTLADHVEALKRAHGIVIEVRVEGVPRLPLDDEVALFRIAQEALQNAIKHGGGAPVSVLLRHGRAGTELDIKDKGPGFDPGSLPPAVRTMGLGTMHDRAHAIRAEFEVKSAPGKGCEVYVFLPARGTP
jgi:signal transduction histidine kinase